MCNQLREIDVFFLETQPVSSYLHDKGTQHSRDVRYTQGVVRLKTQTVLSDEIVSKAMSLEL